MLGDFFRNEGGNLVKLREFLQEREKYSSITDADLMFQALESVQDIDNNIKPIVLNYDNPNFEARDDLDYDTNGLFFVLYNFMDSIQYQRLKEHLADSTLSPFVKRNLVNLSAVNSLVNSGEVATP